MSPEKEEELKSKYPHIFNQKHFYFDCGDGWYDLINTLCHGAQEHINWTVKAMHNNNNKFCPQITAVQVKEKFGSLRFYYDGGDDYIRGMVSFAESMSAKTCENCGEKATVKTNGWIKNLCSPCAEKSKK
jgi:hypothetical protein